MLSKSENMKHLRIETIRMEGDADDRYVWVVIIYTAINTFVYYVEVNSVIKVDSFNADEQVGGSINRYCEAQDTVCNLYPTEWEPLLVNNKSYINGFKVLFSLIDNANFNSKRVRSSVIMFVTAVGFDGSHDKNFKERFEGLYVKLLESARLLSRDVI